MSPEQLRDERFEPPILETGVPFHGAVWDIRRDTFDYNGSPITREYVDHTGTVAVLAIDERDRILLIRQYRHPIRHRDWELPAGLLDIQGEDPLVGAQRELAEEADLAATDWHLLTDFMTSVGGSNEALRVYLARGLSDTEAFARFDEELDIEKRWSDLDEVADAVLDRRLQNSILAIAVLAAKVGRERGWSTLTDPNAPWTRHPRFGG